MAFTRLQTSTGAGAGAGTGTEAGAGAGIGVDAGGNQHVQDVGNTNQDNHTNRANQAVAAPAPITNNALANIVATLQTTVAQNQRDQMRMYEALLTRLEQQNQNAVRFIQNQNQNATPAAQVQASANVAAVDPQRDQNLIGTMARGDGTIPGPTGGSVRNFDRPDTQNFDRPGTQNLDRPGVQIFDRPGMRNFDRPGLQNFDQAIPNDLRNVEQAGANVQDPANRMEGNGQNAAVNNPRSRVVGANVEYDPLNPGMHNQNHVPGRPFMQGGENQMNNHYKS